MTTPREVIAPGITVSYTFGVACNAVAPWANTARLVPDQTCSEIKGHDGPHRSDSGRTWRSPPDPQGEQ